LEKGVLKEKCLDSILLLLNVGDVAFVEVIEDILLPVQSSRDDPEDDACDPSEDAHDAVIPYQQWIGRERDEGFAESGSESGHEQEHRHDEGPHVMWCLGERVLKTGDGGEDLAERDKNVCSSLNPYVEGGDLIVGTFTGAVTARASLVDIMLEDGSPDHRAAAGEKSERDLLERAEVDLGATEGGVDQKIADGDEDD